MEYRCCRPQKATSLRHAAGTSVALSFGRIQHDYTTSLLRSFTPSTFPSSISGLEVQGEAEAVGAGEAVRDGAYGVGGCVERVDLVGQRWFRPDALMVAIVRVREPYRVVEGMDDYAVHGFER